MRNNLDIRSLLIENLIYFLTKILVGLKFSFHVKFLCYFFSLTIQNIVKTDFFYRLI